MAKELIYIANARIPTEKAHGLAIMSFCQALAHQADLELIVPRARNAIKEDPFKYYGMEKSFKITRVPVLDPMPFLDKSGFYLQSLTYAISACVYCLFKKADIFYGRDELTLTLLSLFKKNVVWEAHIAKKKWLVGGLLKRLKFLVVISGGLKSYYRALGAPKEKIIVSPTGVNTEEFSIGISQKDARQSIGLPQDKKIILYTGHLYDWKGVKTLAEAALNLTPEKVVVFVGGTEKDLSHFRQKYGHAPQIFLVGQKSHSQIPFYLKASDVLVIPNSAKEEISRHHTSPLKLFEYMASGVPIVASDLPSIREILNESMGYFFTPDDKQSLKETLEQVFSQISEAQKKAKIAKDNAGKYSWDKRASALLDYLYENE